MDLCNWGTRNAKKLSISISLVISPLKKNFETVGTLKDMKKRESRGVNLGN